MASGNFGQWVLDNSIIGMIAKDARDINASRGDKNLNLKTVLSKFVGADHAAEILKGSDDFYSGLTSQLGGQNSASQALMNAAGKYLGNLVTTQGLENDLNRDFNAAQNALNREFQSAEAQIQRDWYEQMSNSAYQRAVSDLKAAGLNPALAYSQGGAASSGTGVPSGSAASYTATGGDTLSSVLSSIAEVISSMSGASASKISSAFKIFRMAGG